MPVKPADSAVPQHPPPWHLTGRGYVVAMRYPGAALRERSFLPEGLRPTLRGPLAYWMFVDYTTADCGPYHELLFIPGRCQFSGERLLTISKIYVSSESSVVNGRRNWGIPKERCDFDVRYGVGGEDHVRLSRGGQPIAELAFRPFGPRLPMVLHWLPRRWLTLGQHHEGREFVYAPEARGRFRGARLRKAWSDPAVFPDLGAGRALGCFAIPDFQMTFPLARITPLT